MLPPQTPEIDVNALMRGLVHELRNPLSAILTASNLLETGEGMGDESAMLLDVVKKEARRMNRILTEFASFVKPPQPHHDIFDVAAVLRRMLVERQREDAHFSTKITDELPEKLWVSADLLQTEQALRHILCNALEAMRHDGSLRLLGRSDAHTTWITIEDSGGGLAENEMKKAFQPFFSTKPASTGLGLAIARSLLLASGGNLILENRVATEIEEETSLNPPPKAQTNADTKNADLPAGKPLGARAKIYLPSSEPGREESA